jgi:P27 family predicted phage terminase small subunit
MRGRKPTQSNVVPLTGASTVEKNERPRRAKAMWLAYRMRPRGLGADLRREWMRVGTILADPALDRLKPHFLDTVLEYCQATVRLRDIRKFFVDLQETRRLKKQFETAPHTQIGEIACEHPLAAEVYEVEGRNGMQLKSHPLVAQMNEVWRQWRSLMMELGLSPASERNMMPGQGDLFDDPSSEFYGR